MAGLSVGDELTRVTLLGAEDSSPVLAGMLGTELMEREIERIAFRTFPVPVSRPWVEDAEALERPVELPTGPVPVLRPTGGDGSDVGVASERGITGGTVSPAATGLRDAKVKTSHQHENAGTAETQSVATVSGASLDSAAARPASKTEWKLQNSGETRQVPESSSPSGNELLGGSRVRRREDEGQSDDITDLGGSSKRSRVTATADASTSSATPHGSVGQRWKLEFCRRRGDVDAMSPRDEEVRAAKVEEKRVRDRLFPFAP